MQITVQKHKTFTVEGISGPQENQTRSIFCEINPNHVEESHYDDVERLANVIADAIANEISSRYGEIVERE